MGKSGKTLKAALQSQQSRLRAKEKAKHSSQVAEQKQKQKQDGYQTKRPSSTGKGKATISPRKPTIPFRSTDKILLIGEGNFSFARALVHQAPPELQYLPAENITATAYDTEEECYKKYPDARDIVADLRGRGVEILFGVDATRLDKISAVKRRKWDRVVWNFPHAGMGIADQDRNIRSNQVLVLGFLRSAARILSLGPVPTYTTPRRKKVDGDDEEDDDEGAGEDALGGKNQAQDIEESAGPLLDEIPQARGTILITLRNVPPYTLWEVPRLAKKPPPPISGSTPPNPRFILLRSFLFHRDAWKGYEHRMTKGERAHGTGRTGDAGEDRTWEFCLRDES